MPNLIKCLVLMIGIWSMLFCAGCIAGGGGGSFHIPPINFDANIQNKIEVGFTLAGDDAINIPIRYTNISLAYFLNSDPQINVMMDYKGISDGRGIWVGIIPVLRAKKGDKLSYVIVSYLDKHKNVRNESVVIDRGND